MGSKNLKAIAVRGTLKPEWHDAPFILAKAKEGNAKVHAEGFYKIFSQLGTTMNVEWNSGMGGLPTRNWTMGTWEHRDDIRAETYHDTMMDAPGTCWACAQACKRDIKSGITKPWTIESRYGGPEYETVGMCGSNCLVHDLDAIAKANEICSKYGMDTITAGGVVGFVMECFARGVLTAKDTGGVEARFGDGAALVALVELMARREGFGKDMSEGTARLAKKLGKKAEAFAIHVKGKEFPAYMPQTKGLMAFAYAVNPFGPDHVSSAHDGDFAGEINEANKGLGLYVSVPNREMCFEKAKDFAYTQRAVSAVDSFTVCQFTFNAWTIYGFQDLADCVSAATGWRYTLQELMLLGERRINMMKVFNAREGFDSSSDVLPDRIFDEGLADDGPGKGAKVDRAGFMKGIREAPPSRNAALVERFIDTRTEEILPWMTGVSALSRLRRSRLMLWGGSYGAEMPYTRGDPAELERLLFAEVMTEQESVLVERARGILAGAKDRAGGFLGWLSSHGVPLREDGRMLTREAVRFQAALYLAARDRLEELAPDGVCAASIKCHYEMSIAPVGCTACLLPAFLPFGFDAEGARPVVPFACEGDLYAPAGLAVLHAVNPAVPPLFGDLVSFRPDHVLLRNCGASSVYWAARSGELGTSLPRISLEPNIHGRSGASVHFETPGGGPVTFARLFRDQGELLMFLGEARVAPEGDGSRYADPWPHTRLVFPVDHYDMFKAVPCNHGSLTEGAVAEKVERVCAHAGIRVVRCDREDGLKSFLHDRLDRTRAEGW